MTILRTRDTFRFMMESVMSNYRHRFRLSISALSVWVVLGLPAPVLAQGVLEEITVTAQKRAQDINDVGIAVTAFSAEAIKDFEITDIQDIAAYTPGLTQIANAGYSGTASFSLRGAGLNNYAEAGEATVAIYQDEVYLASARGGSAIGIFDLERIEVLRGPQGTLFGRSATGGLVHFISKRPTDEFEAGVLLRYGSYNELRGEMSIGGGVSDSVSLRLSGYWNEFDGWLNNTIGEDQYGEEKYAVRGQALLQFTENTNFLFKAEYGKHKNPNGIVYLNKNTYRDAEGLLQDLPEDLDAYFYGPGNNYTDFYGFRDRDGEFFTGTWADNGHSEIERTLLSGILTVEFGGATLTSITSAIDSKQNYTDVNNMGPSVYVSFIVNPENEQFSQELRLSGETDKYTWTVGGFYLNWDLDSFRDNILPIGYFPGFPPYDLPANLVMLTRQEVEALAIFGQMEFALSDRFTAIIGARLENNEADFFFDFVPGDPYSATVFGPPYSINQAQNGDQAKIDEEYYSGTLQLDYRPNDNTLVYGSIRRGIKPGTFNVPFSYLPPEDFKVDEEQLTAYEVGLKKTLLDGRAQINGAAFYYDYKDYQAVFVQGVSVRLTNAPATIYGLELEGFISPTDGLDLGMGLSLLEGNVEDITLGTGFFGGPPYVTRDREVPNMPKTSINAYARYKWPVFGGTASVQGDVFYQDSIHFEIQNHPGLTAEDFITTNVRVAWEKDGLEIAGFVRNLFEEEYVIFLADLTDFGGYADLQPGKPRWWGVEFRYRW